VSPPPANRETEDFQPLLRRAQEGDPEAFCELCRKFEGRLLRHAAALCGEQELAEDLAQETLFDAWKCIRRYNGRCQFFTWLSAILLNKFRNFLRERRPMPFSALVGSEGLTMEERLESRADPANQPDWASDLSERSLMVWNCLLRLPEKQREVVYLRFYVDESLEGIAAAIGCSLGTVKSRLFHALEKLRGMKSLQAHFERESMEGDSV
jgi:RNA polymerase sigma-70 factor (ECF subfamily)